MFIATVLRQRSELAARRGCALLPDGCVEVDELARTSVPGVYADFDLPLPPQHHGAPAAPGDGDREGSALTSTRA